MRLLPLPLLTSLILLLTGPILSAQGTVNYSHNTAGDLSNRSATGGEERATRSSVSQDSLLTKEQILARLGFQSGQTDKRNYTPSRFFNADSIALRRDRILARLQSRAQNDENAEVDTSLALGQIPISSTVTQTGARIYSVPIPKAAGYSFVPEVSLVYNSQGGEGDAGYGWNVAGISAITVRSKSVYYNGVAEGARYWRDDQVYALDGVPLVQNSVAAMSSYDYETVTGHILVKKVKNEDDRVLYFKALYPDGRRAVFGFTEADSPHAVYPVTEMEDLYGNAIHYTYLSTGQLPYYINQITYGNNQQSAISFQYENRTASAVPASQSGETFNNTMILKTVVSSDGLTEIATDSLFHTQLYGTYLVSKISRSRGEQRLNPLRFWYAERSEGEEPVPEIDELNAPAPMFINGFGSDVPIRVIRGKMRPGSYSDGLIILPVFENYGTSDYIHYGSQYPANQEILIYEKVASGQGHETLSCGSGFQDIQAIDVNGDGRDEVVKINYNGVSGDSTCFRVYVYGFSETGSTLHSLDTLEFKMYGKFGFPLFNIAPDRFVYHYGDFTGEGRIQLMVINAAIDGSNLHTRILDLGTHQIVYDGTTFNPDEAGANLFSYDIDGDGVTEICRATSTLFSVYRFNEGYSAIVTKDYPTYSELQDMVAVGDLNGDGYLDIICAPSDSTKLNCYSYDGNGFSYHNLLNNYDRMAGDTYFITDINKDGFGDIVRTRGNAICVFVSDKAEFSPLRVAQTTLTDGAELVSANVSDFGGLSSLIALSGTTLYSYSYSYNRSFSRLLTSSCDSYGNFLYSHYQDISTGVGSTYSVDWNRSYSSSDGYARKPLALFVVGDEYAQAFIPSALSKENHYYYQDAVSHLQGLGFCGFGSIVTKDDSNLDITGSGTEFFTTTIYNPQNSGVVTSVTRRISSDIDGPLVDTTFYVYTKEYHPHRKNTPRLDSVIVLDNLGGFKTASCISYGTYDFVSSQQSVKQALDEGSGPGRVLSTETSYQYSHQINDTDSLWLLGNVTSQVAARYNDDSVRGWKERTNYTFSSRKAKPNTALTYVGIVDPNAGTLGADHLLTEAHYTYDTHGNVTSEQTASYGGTTFHGSTYTYDAQGRFLLSETDAAGLTTSYSGYNIFGKPTTVIDPRGNVTSYNYDNWGNLLAVLYPVGRIDNTTYRWALEEIQGSLYKVTVGGNVSPTQTTWYSSLGQELRTGLKRFDGDTIYTDKQYSNGGLLLHESLPYKNAADTIRWSRVHYDLYGRVDTVRASSGAMTIYEYNGRATVTTEDGISTGQVLGANGNPIATLDNGGTIQYYYRPDGQPDSLHVKVGGSMAHPVYATTQFTYDAYGRRTSVIDPSAGTRSDAYTDNADGSSSVVHTTSNGTVTTYRDTLGRIILVQRHDNGSIPVPDPDEPEERAQRASRNPSLTRSADFNTTYTYNGYGDLVSAVSNNGTSTYYTYDTLGRVVTQREIIPGSQWLQRTFSYDTAGRVTSTAYTTGTGISVTESYTYTNGYHTATTARDTTIWQLLAENSLGQPTLAATGTAGRSYAYDADGFPQQRTLWNDQDELVMDFRYSYDHATGNMTWREDATREVTNEDFARESFTYDGLNRLTAMGDNLLSDPRDVTYSNSGNVTSIDGNGDFYYPGNQSRYPYRISDGDIGDLAWCPDPNISLGYTSYDRPMYINSSSGLVEFTYNDAGERVSTVSSVYMGSEEGYRFIWGRYYIGGRYEREVTDNTTRETLWLGGDAYSAPMIFYRENNTGGALYNIGRDVQGSITHLATADGTLLKEYSYDPWGRQRDPDTHAFPTYGPLPDGEEEERTATSNTTLIPTLHRGYCGHEHLESFGLINMNARLYDPFNGRFFSPDPYVQAPDFSQSFNRYAYCLNNPLKYRDESGEFFVVDSFLFGLIFGGSYYEAFRRAWNDIKITAGFFITNPHLSEEDQKKEFRSRYTKQIFQTLGGWLTAQAYNTWNINGGVESVEYSHGATVVTTRDAGLGGVTQGCYIVGGPSLSANPNNELFQHEYGHYLQSLEMGWAYYSRVGIPSLLSIKERHRNHPIELDANRRAFIYFSKTVDGFFENSKIDDNGLGWRIDKHPFFSGINFSLSCYDSIDEIQPLFNTIRQRPVFTDYLSWIIPIIGPIVSGVINTLMYNTLY